ncbi:glycoside hydrolase family 38 N-terminal domain-containing protein [Terrabacter terrigena]|uniref:Glycoside hydrolase family 38 N-terminal domain-containing protein n=1 Tax=Terrabacter terrigena TaxID=574718 RepID=A0ABW3N094_9MICO
MTSTVWLVPHTHWDREWYEPFQRFRLRLVDLMDDVVERAAREPDFRFTMDGQMAAIDDYLEVRPEQTDAVRKLVATGQLAIGPWRVLMDEFLCSGETMIRNLEMGWADANRLGEVMPVGYLPDMFGHCAQMPQILRHVGIEQAVVYRGVPAEVDRHEFWWRSPDGTGVRTEFLANSYGNVADVFGGGAARERLAARLGTQTRWYDGDFLAMYGTDHAAPLPSLMGEVADLAADADGPHIKVATLTEYLAEPRTPEPELRTIDGELRSHARSNILPGVLSVRWHLKEAMARTERLLTRYAEPFAALYLPTLPSHYLSMAWRRVIDSSCHDSVTGCGVDETAVQVLARLQEGEHAAQAVQDRALALAASATPIGSLVIANPLASHRSDVVELTVPAAADWAQVGLQLADGTVVPAQQISRPDAELARETVRSEDLPRLMHRVHDRELFGLQVHDLEIDDGAMVLTFHLADHGDPDFDAIAAEARLRAAAERAGHGTEWRVVTRDEPRRAIAASVRVPSLGWTTARVVELAHDRTPATGPDQASIRVGDRVLDNRLVRVEVADDGSLIVSAEGVTLRGVGRLVDGGDAGDSYNYAPPAHDVLVDTPTDTHVAAVGSTGPIVGALRVDRRYGLPVSSNLARRSAETESTLVSMHVEVRTGEPFVRLRLDWQNRTRDHRLRLHVPTAEPADHSHAQGQLAVVRRGRTAEAGPVGEYPLPTFPAETFVDAGGAGILLGRTVEYEVVDGDVAGSTEVAVTLLRSIGYLSRNVHPYRSEPAGPQLPTPEAQVLGPCTMSLAVMPHRGSWADAGLAQAADAYLHAVVVRAGTAPAETAPGATEGLTVGGAGVQLVSLRRRQDDDTAVEVRLLNSSDDAGEAVLGSEAVPVRSASRVDGMGRAGDTLDVEDGILRLRLRAWEIATVRLDIGAPLTP